MPFAPTLKRLRGPILRASLIAAIAWPLSLSVQAQSIQKCHIDGRLVFQSGPCPLEPVAVASPPAAAAAPAATAASGPAKKRSLADVLSARDAADRAPSQAPDAAGDGSKVLRSRMGAY